MKQQIVHRLNRELAMFECEAPEGIPEDARRRHAVEKAVKAEVNLRDADLRDADLRDADLRDADLRDADLRGADLRDADLDGANLRGANLMGANLRGANLRGANLRGANLRDADLRGADLDEANLNRVFFENTHWSEGILINRMPIQILGLHWTVYILDLHMKIGCELHTIAEWTAFNDAQIVAMSGKTALRFWHTHKAALLALATSNGRGVSPPSGE